MTFTIHDKFGYKLTIESVDSPGVERKYEESQSFKSQSEMEESLVLALRDACEAAFNCGFPQPEVFLRHFSSNRLMRGLGLAVMHYWDAENNVDEFINVSIDIDKLMPSHEEDEKQLAASDLATFGISTTRSESDA